MNNCITKVSELLMKISNESKQISSESAVRNLIDKYDMMFLGEHFNRIYSSELLHCLNNVLNININKSELNSIIPSVCKNLNMKFQAMSTIDNPGCIDSYEISLW